MSKQSEAAIRARDEARATLRRRLRVGSIVYVTQHHVSRSGMLRHLSLSIIRNGQPVDITEIAALAMGQRAYYLNGRTVLKVDGCGMDMHFATVYNLARSLRPNGHYCTGESAGPRRCPSNDHVNDWGMLAREYDERYGGPGIVLDVATRSEWIAAQPTYDKGRMHSDSGYSLTHRSL